MSTSHGHRSSPSEAKISQETKRPCHFRNSEWCAHHAWCVQPPPWWRCGASDRRIAFDREGKCASRRDARGGRRTWKVIARSASFSFSLLLVSSSIVLDDDRPAQRDRCASAAAPPLLRLAAPLSPPAPRLARPFSGCLSTPRLRSSCVCVWPAAVWPLGGLPSAVCGCSNATDGTVGRPTARGPRGSHLAPAEPDRGGKLRAALCWLMCFISLPTLEAKKTPCGPGRRRGMAALWQR
jgi:hypothetical protein